MSTESLLSEILAELKAITEKIEYQSKLFEESFLQKDEGTKAAQQQFGNSMRRLVSLIEGHPGLKDNPMFDFNALKDLLNMIPNVEVGK